MKMKLIEATIRLLVVDEAKHEDVFAVEQWVLMSQNTVTVNTSSSKRKFGEDGLPNETPTTTHIDSFHENTHPKFYHDYADNQYHSIYVRMSFFSSGVPNPLILQSWFIAAWKAFN